MIFVNFVCDNRKVVSLIWVGKYIKLVKSVVSL